MKTHAALAVAGLVAGSAAAQYTDIEAPRPSEQSHAQLLSGALGQAFSAAGSRGRDLASSGVYADRIKDRHDQVWSGGNARATIFGREAGYSHTFGFMQDGDFNALLDTDDVGGSTTFSIDGRFEWALKVDEGNGGDLWRSKNRRNRDGEDHMITYALYENDSLTGYALFFEDLPGSRSDGDFNDTAVLLTLVPTPQTAGLALAGLGGVGLTAARRRRG